MVSRLGYDPRLSASKAGELSSCSTSKYYFLICMIPFWKAILQFSVQAPNKYEQILKFHYSYFELTQTALPLCPKRVHIELCKIAISFSNSRFIGSFFAFSLDCIYIIAFTFEYVNRMRQKIFQNKNSPDQVRGILILFCKFALPQVIITYRDVSNLVYKATITAK